MAFCIGELNKLTPGLRMTISVAVTYLEIDATQNKTSPRPRF
jgi:hypothetical protein